MAFLLAWPEGIEAVLAAVFVLIGALGLALALSSREFPLAAAGVVHVLAGLLAMTAADLVTLLVSWELLTLFG